MLSRGLKTRRTEMNELMRFRRVTKVYTDINKRIEDVGGELKMGTCVVKENPTCGSCGCHGGWLADHFKTKVYSMCERFELELNHRQYEDGLDALLDHLDFKNHEDLREYLKGVWHNNNTVHMFSGDDKSFNCDGTTTFPDISKYMIEAFRKKACDAGYGYIIRNDT